MMEPSGETPVPVAGASVGVLGLRRSGEAAARLLAAAGARVYASDTAGEQEVRKTARRLVEEGIEAQAGAHDPERLGDCDWFVVSPGIPPSAAVLQEGVVGRRPVFAELEIAAWFARAPIVAITGTNGKSTTTELVGEIVRAAGLKAGVGGNIGRSFSTAVLEDAVDWFVIETSSFQLAGIATFRPRVAVVLNLSPDHLDRYPDYEAYVRDKERIALNQTSADALCLNGEDPDMARFSAASAARRLWFDRERPVDTGAMIEDGWITLTGTGAGDALRVLPVDRLKLPGWHNVQNALAAALAAAEIGIQPAVMAEVLARFEGLPHRLETVATRGDVRWVNDSKATNVDSAEKALAAFGEAPLIVILGGRPKNDPYAPLIPGLAAHARQVLAIGEAAERIASELDGAVPVEIVATLERAVDRARALARPGDVVLLSPACASYDQFTGYEARGERFRQLVLDGSEAGQ